MWSANWDLPAALGDSLSCWFWLHSQSQYLLACNQPEEAKCSANKCSYWNDTDMGAAFLLQPWTAILSKMSDWLLIGFLNWKDRIQVWYINNSTKKRLTFVKLASLVRSPVWFASFLLLHFNLLNPSMSWAIIKGEIFIWQKIEVLWRYGKCLTICDILLFPWRYFKFQRLISSCSASFTIKSL